MWLHLCSCSWHFLNSPAGGSLGEEQFSFSPTPTPPPPAYQQNRKNVDSAMCLLFSGLRMGFPRLFLQNGYFGIQSIIRKEPICICVCVTMQYTKAQKKIFFLFVEIPLVLYLFGLISVTWLWGGLHMAYRHFWMLVLFVIFNSLQVSLQFGY